MAVTALETPVRTLEPIARSQVIERLCTLLSPPDQLEVWPMMLDMTTLATTMFLANMQALSGLHALSEKAMAVQAQGGCHTLPAFMAPEAVATAFQVFVGPAELARRDLGHRNARGRTHKSEHGEGNSKAVRTHLLPPHAYPVMSATPMCTNMKRYMTIANGLCRTCQ